MTDLYTQAAVHLLPLLRSQAAIRHLMFAGPYYILPDTNLRVEIEEYPTGLDISVCGQYLRIYHKCGITQAGLDKLIKRMLKFAKLQSIS